MSYSDISRISNVISTIHLVQRDLNTLKKLKEGDTLYLAEERSQLLGTNVSRLAISTADQNKSWGAYFSNLWNGDEKNGVVKHLRDLEKETIKLLEDVEKQRKSLWEEEISRVEELHKHLFSLKESLDSSIQNLRLLNQKDIQFQQSLSSDLNNLIQSISEQIQVMKEMSKPSDKPQPVHEKDIKRLLEDIEIEELVAEIPEDENQTDEEEFVIVEKPQVKKDLSKISSVIKFERLKNNFKEFEQSSITCQDLTSQILINKNIIKLIRIIKNEIAFFPNEEKIILFITDLLFFSSYNFSIDEKSDSNLEIISVKQCEIILYNFLEDIQKKDMHRLIHFYDENMTIFQRMLCFSTFNLNPQYQRIVFRDPLFQATLKSSSDHLTSMLFASQTHVPQAYRQTCKGECFNRSLQKRIVALPSLIILSRTIVNQTEEKIASLSMKDKENSAFQLSTFSSWVGKIAPTKEAFAKQRVNQVNEALKNLENEYFQLLDREESSIQKLNELYQMWNFTLQYLYNVIDPKNPRVFSSHQKFPHWYYTSAAISSIANTLQTLVPSEEPSVYERGAKDIDDRALREISLNLFDQSLSPLFGEKYPVYAYNNSEGLENNQITIEEIWEQLVDRGFGILNLSGIHMGRSSGHAIYIEGWLQDKEKYFYLSDPMQPDPKILSLKEMRNYFIKEKGCFIFSTHS